MSTIMEQMPEEIAKQFSGGSKLLSLHHYPKDGTKVKLDIDQELLPYLYRQVDLLSPVALLDRHLVYMYTERLIGLFHELKQEGSTNPELLAIMETLLLALDYLSHERLFDIPFEQTHRDTVRNILLECFEEKKSYSFTTDHNRPILLQSSIFMEDDNVYTLDEREERVRLYMAVFYLQPKNQREHFTHVGHWLGKVDMKPNASQIPYEDFIKGFTDHHLHQDTLYFFNMCKRALVWFTNTYSWRNNELAGFDRMDLHAKLGLYR